MIGLCLVLHWSARVYNKPDIFPSISITLLVNISALLKEAFTTAGTTLEIEEENLIFLGHQCEIAWCRRRFSDRWKDYCKPSSLLGISNTCQLWKSCQSFGLKLQFLQRNYLDKQIHWKTYLRLFLSCRCSLFCFCWWGCAGNSFDSYGFLVTGKLANFAI